MYVLARYTSYTCSGILVSILARYTGYSGIRVSYRIFCLGGEGEGDKHL